MTFFKRILITTLILSILGLHFSPLICAEQGSFSSRPAITTSITEHSPEMLAPPEEKIPFKEIAKKPRKTWLWILGGALVVGSIAAAGGGGGGGAAGAAGGEGEEDTGEVTVEW